MVKRSSRACRLLAATILGVSGVAQAQSPPAGATPPARVGRLAALQGTVSFHAAGSDGWVAAVQNYPVTSGDGVFAQSGGHAELDVGTDMVELDGGSELDVATLDDQQFVASEPQGRVFLAIGPQAPGAVNTIATPRGTVQIAGQGDYEIVAGDSASPTTVTVVQGSATVTASGLSLTIPAGQTAVVTGADQLSGQLQPAGAPDPFLAAMLAEVQRAQQQLPPQVAGMTGCQALAHVGTWRPSPQYGQVWYPPVQAGWTPYREGHWAYVQPWGWTWIDNESWGFAPFHYGRWVDDGGQWGWVPADAGVPEGEYAEPVYAPALVSWTDVGEAALAGAAAGALAAAAIGWIPLGPNEPYYPPYHYDRGYFDRVNRVDVRNISNVSITNVHQNFNTFVNRRGATMVPANVLRGGEPVGRAARPFTPAAFAHARPVPPGQHVLGAPPALHGEPGRGPAINPAFFHPKALQGGRLPFRGGPAAGVAPAASRPGQAAPGGGLPGLRPHQEVLTGRPGPVPGRPGEAAPRGSEAGGPGRPEAGHPGLVAGAAGVAAGAAGAGLAAHAFHGGPGAPGRPQEAGVGHPQAQPPHPVEEPRAVRGPEAPRPEAPPQQHFAPHVAPHVAAVPAHQAPAPHVAPRAERPPQHVAPRPAPAPHFEPRAAPAPHFAPRPAPAPHVAAQGRPGGGPHGDGREPPHH